MNVDKLKKMNILANTLKTHGLAATSEDAVSLAGTMAGSKEEQEFTKIFVTDEQKIHVDEPENEKPTINQEELLKTQPEEKNNEKALDEMKGILQRFADQFCEEVNKINEKIDAHEEKFANYQEILTKVNTPKVEEEQPQTQIITEKEEKTIEEIPKEESTNNPRSGGFESNDVSIEKFFYCGTK